MAANFKRVFAQLDPEKPLTLYGRIVSKREASSSLIFVDVCHANNIVQAVLSKKEFESADAFESLCLKRGDIVGKLNLL